MIGTEIPGVERWLEFARRHPGESSDFDELLEGYEAATSAGAEIWFLDYRDLPASFADEVISIAPYPGLGARGEDLASAVETAGVMAHVIKPGGRIYVAADTIFAARDVTEELGRRLDVAIEPTKLVPVPYVSEYLRHREGAYWAHEIEVISP